MKMQIKKIGNTFYKKMYLNKKSVLVKMII